MTDNNKYIEKLPQSKCYRVEKGEHQIRSM